jgi:hypothetical protein
VHVHTGQVEFGRLIYFPSFYLGGTMGGDAKRDFIIIDFGPDHIRWALVLSPKDHKSGSQIIDKDSQTEAYSQAVRDGLNRAFEYAVLATTK